MPPRATIHKDFTRELKPSYKGDYGKQLKADRKARKQTNITYPEFVRSAKLAIIGGFWNEIASTFDATERAKEKAINKRTLLMEKRAQVHRKAIQQWWDAHKDTYIPLIKEQIYNVPPQAPVNVEVKAKKRRIVSYDESEDDNPEPPPLAQAVHQDQVAEEGPMDGEDRAQAQAIEANAPPVEVKKKNPPRRSRFHSKIMDQ